MRVAQSQEVEEEVGCSRVLEYFLVGGCGCVPIEKGVRVTMPTYLPLAEKLYGSSGPELRRSLFSLKQIFQVRPRGGLGGGGSMQPEPSETPPWCPQEDKDLVPEFVHSEGLSCLIRVGAAADHNYQSYILRGQPRPSP